MDTFLIEFQDNIINSIDWIFAFLMVMIGGLIKFFMYSTDFVFDTQCKYRRSHKSDLCIIFVAFGLSFLLLDIMSYEVKYLYVFWNTIGFVVLTKIIVVGFWFLVLDVWGYIKKLSK